MLWFIFGLAARDLSTNPLPISLHPDRTFAPSVRLAFGYSQTHPSRQVAKSYTTEQTLQNQLRVNTFLLEELNKVRADQVRMNQQLQHMQVR